MLKKGSWKDFVIILTLIDAGIILFSAIAAILLGSKVCLLLMIGITFLSVVQGSLYEETNFYFNVRGKTVRTEEAVQTFLVAGRDPLNESVILEMAENVYFRINDTKSYALTKEGETARVLVKLYFDQEGDVIYVEPLQVIGDLVQNANANDTSTIPQKSPA